MVRNSKNRIKTLLFLLLTRFFLLLPQRFFIKMLNGKSNGKCVKNWRIHILALITCKIFHICSHNFQPVSECDSHYQLWKRYKTCIYIWSDSIRQNKKINTHAHMSRICRYSYNHSILLSQGETGERFAWNST